MHRSILVSRISSLHLFHVEKDIDMMIPYLPRAQGLTIQSLHRLAGGLVLRLPAYTGAGVGASVQ
jgi:hypothetical protein